MIINRKQETADFLKEQLLKKIGTTLELLKALSNSETGKSNFLEFIFVRYQLALQILQAGGSLDHVMIAGGCRAYVDSGDGLDDRTWNAMHGTEQLWEKYRKLYFKSSKDLKRKCDCALWKNYKINSMRELEEIQFLLKMQIEKGIFCIVPVTRPYAIENSSLGIREKYADKWFQCNRCGTVWEIKYPMSLDPGFIGKQER